MFDLKTFQEIISGNIAGIAVIGFMLRWFMLKFDQSQERIVKMASDMCDAFKKELVICQEDKARLLERVITLEHQAELKT